MTHKLISLADELCWKRAQQLVYSEVHISKFYFYKGNLWRKNMDHLFIQSHIWSLPHSHFITCYTFDTISRLNNDLVVQPDN